MTRSTIVAAIAMCLLAGAAMAQAPNAVSGTIEDIAGADLALRTRDGALVHVDVAAARAEHRAGVLYAGAVVSAVGTRDAGGVLHAQTVIRAKAATAFWPADR